MFRSCSEWQHNSGQVGVALGAGPFFPDDQFAVVDADRAVLDGIFKGAGTLHRRGELLRVLAVKRRDQFRPFGRKRRHCIETLLPQAG